MTTVSEGDRELPPLPEPHRIFLPAGEHTSMGEAEHLYTATQVEEIRAQAWQAATQRERELETVLRDLLERNDAVYQTEYDGRMLTCCIGCDADLASNEHEKSCPVVHALTVLASIGKSQSNGRS